MLVEGDRFQAADGEELQGHEPAAGPRLLDQGQQAAHQGRPGLQPGQR